MTSTDLWIFLKCHPVEWLIYFGQGVKIRGRLESRSQIFRLTHTANYICESRSRSQISSGVLIPVLIPEFPGLSRRFARRSNACEILNNFRFSLSFFHDHSTQFDFEIFLNWFEVILKFILEWNELTLLFLVSVESAKFTWKIFS